MIAFEGPYIIPYSPNATHEDIGETEAVLFSTGTSKTKGFFGEAIGGIRAMFYRSWVEVVFSFQREVEATEA
ncbi:MAG: hypothetical protein ACYSYT_00575 [Planctomycetota bacterium]